VYVNVPQPAGHSVAQAASSVSVIGVPQLGTVVVVSITHIGLIHSEVSKVHPGSVAVVVMVYGAHSPTAVVEGAAVIIGPPGLTVVLGSVVGWTMTGSSCSVTVSVEQGAQERGHAVRVFVLQYEVGIVVVVVTVQVGCRQSMARQPLGVV
jgi:hypothetical protein